MIYIAGSYKRRLEFREYAKRLTELGYVITSRWIWYDYEHDVEDTGTKMVHAYLDLRDIVGSDIFLMFTGESTSGGTNVEFGYALAILHSSKEKGFRVIGIGDRLNIFHHLPEIEFFSSVEEFLTEELKENESE